MGWRYPKSPTPEFSGSAADLTAIKTNTANTALRLLTTVGAEIAADLLKTIRDRANAPHGLNAYGYAAGGVTNAWTTHVIGATPAGDAASTDFPDHCQLSALDLEFNTLGGGMNAVIAYLSEDAAGLTPRSDVATIPLSYGRTAGTYVASWLLDRERTRTPVSGTAGKLYLQIIGNAGTCNFVARLGYLP